MSVSRYAPLPGTPAGGEAAPPAPRPGTGTESLVFTPTPEARQQRRSPSNDGKRVVVVALGGNALLRRGEELSMATQNKNVAGAIDALRPLLQDPSLSVVITFGNGPQIGLLSVKMPEVGLDVLGAQSQGQIGFLLEKRLRSCFPALEVACIVTTCLVSPQDPAFREPTKFVGQAYTDRSEAQELAGRHGWVMKEVKGDGEQPAWRRVVPSPAPLKVLQINSIASSVRSGCLTICCGGGGVPVIMGDGSSSSQQQEQPPPAGPQHAHQQTATAATGVEGVIDKDAASALMAQQIGADVLMILTDVPAVFDPKAFSEGRKEPLPGPLAPGNVALEDFASGSMRPKVAAAVEFVSSGAGREAYIGALEQAQEVLLGQKGTKFVSHK